MHIHTRIGGRNFLVGTFPTKSRHLAEMFAVRHATRKILPGPVHTLGNIATDAMTDTTARLPCWLAHRFTHLARIKLAGSNSMMNNEAIVAMHRHLLRPLVSVQWH